MGEKGKIDLTIFADCTPLYDDIAWEPKLVTLRIAMGLEPPNAMPPMPLIQEPAPIPARAGGGASAMFARTIRAAPRATDQNRKPGEGSLMNAAVTIASAAPEATDPKPKLGECSSALMSAAVTIVSDAPKATDPKPKLGEGISRMTDEIKISAAAAAPATPPQPDVGTKRKRGRPRSLDDAPSWLPAGWIIKKKTRKTGTSVGNIDKVIKLWSLY